MSDTQTTKAIDILSALAEGHSVEQLLARDHSLTHNDIMAAANLGQMAVKARGHMIARAREIHPRAYEPWSEKEESDLRGMLAQGAKPSEIAEALQRQTSAIHSRMNRLGLDASAK